MVDVVGLVGVAVDSGGVLGYAVSDLHQPLLEAIRPCTLDMRQALRELRADSLTVTERPWSSVASYWRDLSRDKLAAVARSAH